MTQHTPGPWIADGLRVFAFAGDLLICEVEDNIDADHDNTLEIDANALVISMSPDLLAFARMVAAGNTEIIELERRARNLVTKAGG